jgi:O-antigen ligase
VNLFIQRNRLVLATGALFALLAFAHLPVSIFPHIFDKNAAPQFITLLIISTAMGAFILWKSERFTTHRYIRNLIWALFAVLITSALLSANIVSSFTGDTGRYAGVASLFALVIVAVFHSQFDAVQLYKLITFYLSVSFAIVLTGLAQHFNLIELPGDAGLTSTLGNQDFYAAFIGVSMPLYFFISLKASRRKKLAILAAVLISFYSLVLATPLQSYVDIAFTALGALIYLLRKRIPRKNLTLNVRTFLATFGLIIWAEFIFLVPFLGSWIPVLGNDIQVKIRSNFWLAGTRQFFSHPLFGVGPDQYGNYYENYRTVLDAKNYERILSNDAHSASVQTLATLGVAGTLVLIAFVALLARSFFIAWDRNPAARAWLFAIAIFFFVYMTNSFISPITKPTKFLLWGLAGWVIGKAYYRNRDSEEGVSLRVPIAALLIIVVSIGSLFTIAQWKYASAFEKYAKSRNAVHQYTFNPLIPCVMYFEGEFHIIENNKLEKVLDLARKQIQANPRCVSAHIILAQYYQGVGDMNALGRQLEQLLNIAPLRVEVLRMGLEYASKVGDVDLYNQLQSRFSKLGLIYVPGKTG